jgi:Tol biopolymer transport system component
MKTVLAAGCAVLAASIPCSVRAQVIELVSVSISGAAGNGGSGLETSRRAISADGRFVVFESDASDLVTNDTNGLKDVFLRDRVLGVTVRVSVASNGGDALGASENPALTPDGRFVAFESDAGNIVPGDDNAVFDVFVRDMALHQTIRVSEAHGGGDPDGASHRPALSPDGRYVVFSSYATNLVPGADNGASQIYVRDLDTGETELVSIGYDGSPGDLNSWTPDISPDGRHVGFTSGSTNLVPGDGGQPDAFVRDLDAGVTTRASVDHLGGDPDNRSGPTSLNQDGTLVAFWSRATDLVPGDINGMDDIFVRDVATGVTERVNVTDGGDQTNDGGSWHAAITPDGRYVVFLSDASNLVPGDDNGWGDIFARDRWLGTTENLCLNAAGALANGFSRHPSVTPDGHFVAFESTGENFGGDDSNGLMDVYVAHGPAALLVDGFDGGDVARWSTVEP